MRTLLFVAIACFGVTLASEAAEPLPCVPAPLGHTQPWTHNHQVLSSYPADNPQPVFVGAFADPDRNYRLHLWRDAAGVFGELLSPVLEADSPTSRLYDASLVPKQNAVRFAARFPSRRIAFEGKLDSHQLRGTMTEAGRQARVDLRKMPGEDYDSLYVSRAQFDCAVVLFRRY